MSATLLAAPDLLDEILGVRPGDALDAVRRSRPAARENTQATLAALFAPPSDAELPLADRFAVATFVVALHGADRTAASPLLAAYAGELAPRVRDVVTAQAAAAVQPGPFGVYREPGLAAESVAGERWVAPADVLGERLAAALTHAALLVQRPRESSPDALEALLAAGWSREGVVTLSQLIAFLTYQVRIVAGLAVLKESQP